MFVIFLSINVKDIIVQKKKSYILEFIKTLSELEIYGIMLNFLYLKSLTLDSLFFSNGFFFLHSTLGSINSAALKNRYSL